MRYLDAVQITNTPLSRRFQLKVCVMSLRHLERFFDRIAPALILGLGSSVAVAFAAVGI
jgi:hypothetical protein